MRTRLMLKTALAALALVLLAACGGSQADDGGVASLGGDDSAQSGDTTEQDAQKWAECMRDEGVDIPDPEVDADGNIDFGGPPDQNGGGGDGLDIDRDAMQKATEKCGQPPGAEFTQQDQSQMQDAALEFSQCMRDKGYDVADPDFSNPDAEGFGDNQGQGLFGDLNLDDPDVQADVRACSKGFEGFGPGGGQ